MLEPPITDNMHQKDTAQQAPEKCTDSNMVTLITTVQQITMGLWTADMEEDRAVYGLVI
jgi:hypothetical protein